MLIRMKNVMWKESSGVWERWNAETAVLLKKFQELLRTDSSVPMLIVLYLWGLIKINSHVTANNR